MVFSFFVLDTLEMGSKTVVVASSVFVPCRAHCCSVVVNMEMGVLGPVERVVLEAV